MCSLCSLIELCYCISSLTLIYMQIQIIRMQCYNQSEIMQISHPYKGSAHLVQYKPNKNTYGGCNKQYKTLHYLYKIHHILPSIRRLWESNKHK